MTENEPIDIFSRNPVLENDRVMLRLLEKSDFDNLLEFSLNEPEIWKFGAVTAAGEDNLKKYINTALAAFEERKEYPFIVYDKKAARYTGSTRFYDIQQQWSTAQLGYTWYGKQFQRSGLNRHCKLLLLGFAFEEWGLARVEFRADINNKRSIEAMEGIGCKVEGILRNNMPNLTGGRRTSVVLSILKEEWHGEVKQHLRQIAK